MASLTTETSRGPRWTAWAPSLRVAAWFNLAVQILIVVTGGAVRLTGSGLGCPTWPQCVPGSYTPVQHQAEGIHKHIEFGNRLLTFVVLVAAIVLIAAAVKHARARMRQRRFALLMTAPLIGSLLQAVIGGIVVLLDLHPATVGIHFLVSMALVSVSTVALFQARRGDDMAAASQSDQPFEARSVRVVWTVTQLVVLALFVVLTLGVLVTSAGPHSGDDDTPYRLAWDPHMLSWLHADAVIAFLGLAGGLWLAVSLSGWPQVTKRWAAAVVAVALAQGTLGYVQYFTKLPAVLVGAHMFGAAVLTAVTTAAVIQVARVRRNAVTG